MIRFLTQLLVFFLIPAAVFALGQSAGSTGLGQVAVNMLEPVGLFSDFVSSACLLLGGSFLFATVVKYIEHKRSPLMVPISTVVFLLIAGIALILLPFLANFAGTGVRYSLFPGK